MHHQKKLTILVLCISLLAILATTAAIFSTEGNGSFQYKSIRGEDISIYGKGIYKHMSSGVAVQGIAQDYVTLFIGIPLLLLSLFNTLKDKIRWRMVLTGTLGYFFVTYLFYLVMAMYNEYFLVYTALLGLSFFALMMTALSFDLAYLPQRFGQGTPTKFAGGFLIFTSICIATLWLNIVVPPLLDGSVYPGEVEHYTTLIVQGLDLGLLLPLSFVSGILIIEKKPLGYLLAPSYLVFLSLLMTALVAKIIYMGLIGSTIVPVIFIIPTLTIVSMICAYKIISHIKG